LVELVPRTSHSSAGDRPTTTPQKQFQPEVPTGDGPPPTFLCPISKEVMKFPSIASDGFTYDRNSIAKWLSMRQTSPITGMPLRSTSLLPNNEVQEAIEHWQRLQRLEQQPVSTPASWYDVSSFLLGRWSVDDQRQLPSDEAARPYDFKAFLSPVRNSSTPEFGLAHWEDLPVVPATDGQHANPILALGYVVPTSPECEHLRSLCAAAVPARYRLCHFLRVQHPGQIRQLHVERETLAENGAPIGEKLGWHGSRSVQGCKGILRNGLDPVRSSGRAAMNQYGRGAYLAALNNFEYSARSYCCNVVFVDGEKYRMIFLCSFLPGFLCRTKCAKFIEKDTSVDNLQDPTVYALSRQSQCAVKYILLFMNE